MHLKINVYFLSDDPYLPLSVGCGQYYSIMERGIDKGLARLGSDGRTEKKIAKRLQY